MYHAKEARNEATHTLSHKSNRQNLEKQTDEIKSGREMAWIENQIRKDIFKIFKKLDHLSNITDQRSLQEMFTSFMTTDLIVDCNTKKQVKIDLIRNHTDKTGLFDHIRRIYRDNTQMFVELGTWRFNNKIPNKDELLQSKRRIPDRLKAGALGILL